MNNFSELRLANALERALHAMKFETPTPVQEKAIPLALTGADLIATAQTGTGKTAAFSLPTADFLIRNPDATALVLAPTRELALQIETVWKDITRFRPDLRSVTIIGGASFSVQCKWLNKNPRFIIATPGRLVDHLQRRTVNLNRVSVLVLDEADRMLDMGFAPQLNQILKVLPKQRQTLLFSATWESALDELSKKYLRNPQRISVGAVSRAAGSVEQTAISTINNKKNDTLLDELNLRKGSVLIFTRTKSRTDRLAKYLNSYGLEVARLHGGRSQSQRNSALAAFKQGTVRILVATDIAARGIDVVDISHVINYDLPQAPEDYIHRIGRTGRAGATGQALSLLTPEDRLQWKDINTLLKKTGSTLPQVRGQAPETAPLTPPAKKHRHGRSRWKNRNPSAMMRQKGA
ncbi:DEAD/DEAH box helicase [bacterium]|jgi:ATP-dependent RNA helicase RhlE|nr:DEAD/DEAH box helicase [bacterium]